MPVPGSSIELHHKGRLSGEMFWSVGTFGTRIEFKGWIEEIRGDGQGKWTGFDLGNLYFEGKLQFRMML